MDKLINKDSLKESLGIFLKMGRYLKEIGPMAGKMDGESAMMRGMLSLDIGNLIVWKVGVILSL